MPSLKNVGTMVKYGWTTAWRFWLWVVFMHFQFLSGERNIAAHGPAS